ncbi:MAG: hypothetical protein Q4D27_00005 [Coriobacteriia bacterium]|nr:hypothetical protein [Coriobacteriia bacterium]
MFEMLFGTLMVSIALFLPGYPFFRALRFSSIASFIAAPLFSCAVYGIFPIFYYEVGIPCTIFTTFGVALVIGWAAYFATRRHRSRGAALGLVRLPQPRGVFINAQSARELPFDWTILAVYILCGLVVCSLAFGLSLASPDVPYIRYDNQAHLTISKSFYDSGMWSCLHPNRYLDLPAEMRSIRSGAISFYPTLLYGLTALCGLFTGFKLTAAFNATVFALCAVVFPAGMFGIIRSAFPGNRGVYALGAITTMCFAGFPWGVFVRALFPNIAGFCLMTPAIGATMLCLSSRTLKQSVRPCIALWALGVPVLGLAQPNAVFGAFLFLVAYLAHVVGESRAKTAPASDPKSQFKRRVSGIAAVAIVGLVIWIACMNLPFMRYVVHYFGNSIMDPMYIFRKLLFLRFDAFEGQHLLALVTFIGVVDCIRKKRFWILFPAAWFALAWFIVRTQNTLLTHFLAGFWYTDHVRIAGILCIFLAPIAADGLFASCQLVYFLLGKLSGRIGYLVKAALGTLIVALFAIIVFLPNWSVPIPDHDGERITGFGTVYTTMHDMYSWKDTHVFGGDEHEFVQKVKDIVGDDLVINFAPDGSNFAYPTDDLKVYYRNTKLTRQNDTAVFIRKNLVHYATDEKVREAVDSIGAKWLLLLDYDVPYEEGNWFRQFKNPSKWRGIMHIRDNTPGFTVVLAENDMRLYKIG